MSDRPAQVHVQDDKARPPADEHLEIAPTATRASHASIEEAKARDVEYQLKSDHDELGLIKTAVKFRKAVLICTMLCIAAAADGYQINLNGGVIANQGFVRQVGFPNAAGVYALAPNHTALWGALQSLGQMIAMVFLNPISDRIGRKYTLYVLWVILFGSLIIETFVRDFRDWAGAKLLAGVGVGAIQMTLPVYITEWSPVNIRGAMIVAYGIWNTIGNFIAPVVLTVSEKRDPLDYKVPILTQWGFLGIMLPIFLWLPETAYYFAAKDQHERGLATLRRVNGKVPGYNVEEEYAIIVNIIEEERRMKSDLGIEAHNLKDLWKSYAACLKGVNAKRTLAAALPAIIQQNNGLSFLNIYGAFFFRQVGFSNAFEITSILTAIKIVGVIATALLVDTIGRRRLIIFAGWWCSAMLLIVGAAGQNPTTPAIRNLIIAACCMWSIGNSPLGSLGWTFVGEVPNQKLRARTAGLGAAGGVIFGLTFNTSVPVMLNAQGVNLGYNTAWIFLGLGIIANIVGLFFVPETMRRSPAELDELYEKRIPAWKMRGYVTDVEKNQRERLERMGGTTTTGAARATAGAAAV